MANLGKEWGGGGGTLQSYTERVQKETSGLLDLFISESSSGLYFSPPCVWSLTTLTERNFNKHFHSKHTNTTERAAAFRVRRHSGENAVCGTCQETKTTKQRNSQKCSNGRMDPRP